MLKKLKARRLLKLESLESRCVFSGAPWGETVFQFDTHGDFQLLIAPTQDFRSVQQVTIVYSSAPRGPGARFDDGDFEENRFDIRPEGEGHDAPPGASNGRLDLGIGDRNGPGGFRPTVPIPNVSIDVGPATPQNTTQFDVAPNARPTPQPTILNFVGSGSNSNSQSNNSGSIATDRGQSPTSTSQANRGNSPLQPITNNLQSLGMPSAPTGLQTQRTSDFASTTSISSFNTNQRLDFSSAARLSDSDGRRATTVDSVTFSMPNVSQSRTESNSTSSDLNDRKSADSRDSLDSLIEKLARDHQSHRKQAATQEPGNHSAQHGDFSVAKRTPESKVRDSGMIALEISRELLLGDLDELAADVATERNAWSANLGIYRAFELGGFALNSVPSTNSNASTKSTSTTVGEGEEQVPINRVLASTSVAFLAGAYGIRRVRKMRRLKLSSVSERSGA